MVSEREEKRKAAPSILFETVNRRMESQEAATQSSDYVGPRRTCSINMMADKLDISQPLPKALQPRSIPVGFQFEGLLRKTNIQPTSRTSEIRRKANVAWMLAVCCAPISFTPLRLHAEPPVRLSAEVADRMIQEGDQLADRAEYLKAVELYTDAYMGIVTQIRGQEFLKDVAPSLMTRSELGVEMKRQMEIEYTPEELRLMEACYKVHGLVPNDLDINETMTKLLSEEVGGFYDPRTKAMVLVREDDKASPSFFGKLFGSRPAFDKDEQKVTLSHELTHALQDQLYDLQYMQKSIEKDDDMLMAFSALVEGDATLVMFGEMGRQEGDIRSMTEMEPEAAEFMFSMMKSILPVAGGKTYRNSPRIFRDGLIFPYFQGMVFNLHLARQGGFRQVHRSYDAPPVSTEQILHPDKYLRQVDMPVSIEFEGLDASIPTGWKLLGGNCLGEFQIDILLKNTSNSTVASSGWDGDRYEVFEGPEGKFAMIWATTWDSEQDAKEFEKAYKKFATTKPRVRKKKSDAPNVSEDKETQADKPTQPEATEEFNKQVAGDQASAPSGQTAPELSVEEPAEPTLVPTTIERVGSDVLVVRGFEDAAVIESLMKVLKSAKKSEKSFPVKPRALAN